jgi:hypothetical protein
MYPLDRERFASLVAASAPILLARAIAVSSVRLESIIAMLAIRWSGQETIIPETHRTVNRARAGSVQTLEFGGKNQYNGARTSTMQRRDDDTE